MSQRGRSDSPPAPSDVIWPGLTSGDCMAMAAILQADALRLVAAGGPREVAAVKYAVADLLEHLGTGLNRLEDQ